MADKNNLKLLFYRPQEPVFVQKGPSGAVFDVPDNFLTDRYRPIGPDLQNRFGESSMQRIPVKNITQPDLRIPMTLGRQDPFSLFIPKHRKIAGRLIDIFMGLRNIEDLLSVSVYSRDRLNPFLFNYALSVALLHRPDTREMNIPAFFESFPAKFVDSKVISQMREEATIVPEGSRMPIVLPTDYTASDRDEEHRLWYFREDIGINLHHWHWHLVYPFESDNRALVAKDRRGELFYYMHEQIIARYNFERFSNRLLRVKRLNNFRDAIQEGYFPKLDSLIASRSWPARPDNSILRDINRELDQIKVDISDMERWRDRIFEAIHQAAAVDSNGNRIPLDGVRGIDILGNMIESSILSPNAQFYGDIHNMGHVFISYIHDPDHRHLESFGVMGDVTTAMRDPAFYRWHAFIDDVFQEHKEALPPYTAAQLTFTEVTVVGFNVSPNSGGAMNTFQTFWQQSDVNLARGLDFVPRGNVFARFTHLQHEPFTYTIQINNAGGAQRMGMVRIFMSPKNDERGSPMLFRDQRLMMIEMDKFIVSLRPGQNTIRRRSDESTITIPFERTFRNLDEAPANAGSPEGEQFNFCGCGWPQHMLVPRGTPEGLSSELFVMVSNYADDRVDQSLVGTCNDAASYCGVRDRLYPDTKAMGYPFDRLSRTGSESLASFMTPNMRVREVNIMHTTRTILRQ